MTRDAARLAGLQPVARVADCGKGCAQQVTLIRDAAGGGHLAGVARCASVHSCPDCAAIIRQTRAVELAAAIERWIAEEGRVYFVTLTAAHHGESLGSTLDALGKSWRTLMSGRSRQRLDAALGVCLDGDEQPWAGVVRAVDITHGQFGWHPHFHCVFFVGRWVTPDMVDRYVVDQWLHGTGLAGRQAVSAGCDVRELRSGDGEAFGLAAYALKADRAALELHRIDLKRAGAGRSPWELLGLALDGNEAAADLWREYSLTLHGRRASVWSRRLRSWWGEAEISDETAAEGVIVGKQVLAHISLRDYSRLRRHAKGVAALVVSIETDRWRELLGQLGFSWSEEPQLLEHAGSGQGPPVQHLAGVIG